MLIYKLPPGAAENRLQATYHEAIQDRSSWGSLKHDTTVSSRFLRKDMANQESLSEKSLVSGIDWVARLLLRTLLSFCCLKKADSTVHHKKQFFVGDHFCIYMCW